MKNFKEWYLDKTWRNIWFWRIFALSQAIIFWILVYYLFAEVFPLLDKYAEVYEILEGYGLV